MSSNFWVSFVGSLATGLVFFLLFYSRRSERDKDDNPSLRYLWAPPIMAICAAAFYGVALYQWNVPKNHFYPENLIFLFWLPIFFGVTATCAGIYYFKYRVSLCGDAVRVRRWILADFTFAVDEIESISEKTNMFEVGLRSRRKLKFYKMLSGHVDFFAVLQASLQAHGMHGTSSDA